MKSRTKSQRKGNCHFHPFNILISNQWACIIKHDTLNGLSWTTGAIAPQWCSPTQITSHTPTTRLFLTIKRWLEPRIMSVNRVKKRNTTNWPSIKSSFTNAKWFATKDSLSIRHLCPIVASVIRDTCILAPSARRSASSVPEPFFGHGSWFWSGPEWLRTCIYPEVRNEHYPLVYSKPHVLEQLAETIVSSITYIALRRYSTGVIESV